MRSQERRRKTFQTLNPPFKNLLLFLLITNFTGKLGLEQRSPTFLAPGTSFVEDSFSTDGGGGDGGDAGCDAGDGSGRWSFALAHPPRTSCGVAWLLTGCGPRLVCGPGVGDPWFRKPEFLVVLCQKLALRRSWVIPLGSLVPTPPWFFSSLPGKWTAELLMFLKELPLGGVKNPDDLS